jgi:hypothetical protein
MRDHRIPDDRFEQLRIGARKAPLCYSRQAKSQAIEQARVDAQFSVALIMLSLLTCVAAFMAVYGH